MNGTDAKPQALDRTPAARTIPYYFAAIAGLVYAVGFLTEYTFMNTMGVKDALTEPFKAKHIYIGILCIQFPASIGFVILGMLKMRRAFKRDPSPDDALRLKIYVPCIILFVIFLFAAYMLVTFARASTFSKHFHEIMALFAITVFGPIAVFATFLRLRHKFAAAIAKSDGNEEQERNQKVATVVARVLENSKGKNEEETAASISSELSKLGVTADQNLISQMKKLVERAFIEINLAFWTLLIFALFSFYLTFRIFNDSGGLLGEMMNEGGYVYFGLLLITGCLIWRWDVRREDRKITKPEIVASMTALTFALVAALGYLAVLFFAARVYCYIPAFKGGGDFTTESEAVLHFDRQLLGSLPARVVDTNNTNGQSVPLIILQQNNNTFFVAIPNPTNNPTTWRNLGRTNKPTTIFTIKREAVVSTSYEYGSKP